MPFRCFSKLEKQKSEDRSQNDLKANHREHRETTSQKLKRNFYHEGHEEHREIKQDA